MSAATRRLGVSIRFGFAWCGECSPDHTVGDVGMSALVGEAPERATPPHLLLGRLAWP